MIILFGLNWRIFKSKNLLIHIFLNRNNYFNVLFKHFYKKNFIEIFQI